jgi:hypothetical protein
MVNAILGYVLSGLGIVSVALSSEKTRSIIPIDFIANLSSKTFVSIGIILVAAGIVIMFLSGKQSGSNVRQSAEEVPIYEGEGKHRKIVAYRKG